MKKLLASILLLVYFTVSTGFVVSIHYCMDKIASIELGDWSRDECGKCGMHIEDNGGCCKDDVKMVKMQTDQSFAKITIPDFSVPLPAPFFHELYADTHFELSRQSHPLAHGPPLSEQDTYLFNCVFRL